MLYLVRILFTLYKEGNVGMRIDFLSTFAEQTLSNMDFSPKKRYQPTVKSKGPINEATFDVAKQSHGQGLFSRGRCSSAGELCSAGGQEEARRKGDLVQLLAGRSRRNVDTLFSVLEQDNKQKSSMSKS